MGAKPDEDQEMDMLYFGVSKRKSLAAKSQTKFCASPHNLLVAKLACQQEILLVMEVVFTYQACKMSASSNKEGLWYCFQRRAQCKYIIDADPDAIIGNEYRHSKRKRSAFGSEVIEIFKGLVIPAPMTVGSCITCLLYNCQVSFSFDFFFVISRGGVYVWFINLGCPTSIA